jgi:hypothetical protein
MAGAASAAGKAPIAIVPTAQNTKTAAPRQGELSRRGTKSVVTGNRIDYHNGAILANQVNVYFIWYGNWSGNTATSIVPQFVRDLNRSLYYNTNTTYSQMEIAYDATGHVIDPYQDHVANSLAFGGQVFDAYSFGASLDRSGVQNVVNRALSTGLPVDGNGIYLVLTSADVNVTDGSDSFCTNFCGYHSYVRLHSADVKYGFIGNPDRCGGTCTSNSPPLRSGPNGNPGADGMVNVLAHEINETVTDPYINAWFRGNTTGEVGDLCAWNFGPGPFGPNPNAPFNVTLNGRHYLIQTNYVNSGGGFCGLSFATPSGTPATSTLAVTGVIGCDSGGGGCEDGQIQVQVTDGSTSITKTVFYDGFGSFGPADAQGVANAIASAFNSDPGSPVTAAVTPQGPTIAVTADPDWWITLTTKQNGAAVNHRYVYYVTITPFSSPFQNTTLAITPTPGVLSGGSDSCCSQ